jgi:glycosyltransferase involved in cell wall biosynthesis
MPKISIIMSNFNHGKFLHESIGSLVDQTCKPYELIIIDDCSTDNSVELIEKYAKKYSFIKFFKNTQNKGVFPNVEFGEKISKGDYLAFLSADDRWSKDFIEKSIQFLLKYPNAGLVCSIPCFIGETGQFSHAVTPLVRNLPEYISSSELVPLLKKYFFIAGHTSVIKKSAFLESKGMISELEWHCDWFSMHTIGFRHGICFIPEKLAFLRIVPNSYSASFLQWKKQKKVLKNLFLILQDNDFKDVKNLFFNSKVVLYVPFASLYLLLHFNTWRFLTFKNWKNIFITLFFDPIQERKLIINKIKSIVFRKKTITMILSFIILIYFLMRQS